ncbi:glycosyltransferase family 2 protein [uncultured Chryseobacterium sp.]|uniref:glycosyltransferase family 2 protein n=1 Tax=uncultured Chryseobacterium sp. TaxID=259322 RepID=UPI00258FA21D|nr:glycosyltransferase family 2 protein [uncultured Chryseobacterium sp.]
MGTPLVTVISVSYNHSRYIKENLDSIKNQTYKNIQLIVGDDASSDNSAKVFQEWLQSNNYDAITNFHNINTGLATMLNECIELAEGKYVKIIASDDYLHPESIENCVAAMEKSGDEYGMIFTDFWAIDNNNQSTELFLQYNSHNHFFNSDGSLKKDQLVKYNCIIAPTVLMRKDALISTGKYEPHILLEDHDRWLRINEIKKILFINKKLAYYRVLPTSVTNTRNERMIEEDLYIRMKYDKTGINKSNLFHYISTKYRNSEKISALIKNEYLKYPFRVKRLTFALKNNISPFLYYLLLKFGKKIK